MSNKALEKIVYQGMKNFEKGLTLYNVYKRPSERKVQIWERLCDDLMDDRLYHNLPHSRPQILSFNKSFFTAGYYTYNNFGVITSFTVITPSHKITLDFRNSRILLY